MKNRRDFLRMSGLVGAATLIPFTKLFAGNDSNVCTLMPSETEGPFPYPGGEITNPLNIVDIRGGQTGIPFEMVLTVVDSATCVPLPNVRVDVWHCNKDGDYSGYGAMAGQFWLRGYQITDATGQVQFTSIYPGWYPGRATHVHYELFYNNALVMHSQYAFDESISNSVHTSPLYAASGINNTTNMGDGILGNSASDLLLETIQLTGDVTNGFTGSLTIAVNGVPTSIDKTESALENISVYPNPVTDRLAINHPVADSNTTVKVMTLDGKVAASGKLKTGASITNIDISRIIKGVYILVIEKNSKKSILKFVKM